MRIIEYLDLFAGALINILFYAIVIMKIFQIKTNSNSLLKYISLFLVSLIICIINIYNKDVFKVLITIPFVTIGMKYIFNVKIEKSLLYVLLATFYMFIGEIIVGTVFSILSVDYSFIFENVLGKSIGSITVVIFTMPFLYIKFLNKISNKLILKIKNKKIVVQGFLFLAAISALTYRNTRNTNNIIFSIMNSIIFTIFIVIIYNLYKQADKAEELSRNYNILLTYLEKYEKELDEKRKIVHDFRNQLIVIDGYADVKNKKLKEYISEIISDQKNVSEYLLTKNIDKLPRGLKGLIYYKLSQLNSSIKTDIEIEGKLNKFDELSPNLSKDILKIIGILIDNAIEGVDKTENEYINMKFVMKNNIFTITLINSTSNNFDTSKIILSGFSTKGKGRGYGLSVVSDIVRKNNKIKFKIDNKDGKFEAELKIMF